MSHLTDPLPEEVELPSGRVPTVAVVLIFYLLAFLCGLGAGMALIFVG